MPVDGRIVAMDLLPMEPIPGVTFVQGDFREREGLATLEAALDGRRADLVLSDMAPNLSGIDSIEQIRTVEGWGVHAFLIGESLMRAPEPGKRLRELLS